ncbi:hypothetical protein RND81_05G175200 [Saponaria officinalis]|uniref:RRM domain-containing protein n=1 Tax=Saponaria officinalis TaxID=3572 RepID=A0AAW1L1X8_SAPOF
MVIKRKTNTATTPPSTQSNKQQKNQQPPVQPPDEDEESISTLIEPFTKEQLLTILREAAENHPDIASRVRNVADKDTVHRKIFVHGLDWGTTTDTLRDTFKEYGEIEDCKAVTDKLTGKSKGYGFILFKKRVGAKKALKEPKKRISGRIVSCQLSAVGPVASSDGPKPGKGGRGRGRGRGGGGGGGLVGQDVGFGAGLGMNSVVGTVGRGGGGYGAPGVAGLGAVYPNYMGRGGPGGLQYGYNVGPYGGY